MKCQQCNKTATFHITELTKGKPQELHLCEEHARQYLTQNEDEPAVAPSLAGGVAHRFAGGQAAADMERVGKRECRGARVRGAGRRGSSASVVALR